MTANEIVMVSAFAVIIICVVAAILDEWDWHK